MRKKFAIVFPGYSRTFIECQASIVWGSYTIWIDGKRVRGASFGMWCGGCCSFTRVFEELPKINGQPCFLEIWPTPTLVKIRLMLNGYDVETGRPFAPNVSKTDLCCRPICIFFPCLAPSVIGLFSFMCCMDTRTKQLLVEGYDDQEHDDTENEKERDLLYRVSYLKHGRVKNHKEVHKQGAVTLVHTPEETARRANRHKKKNNETDELVRVESFIKSEVAAKHRRAKSLHLRRHSTSMNIKFANDLTNQNTLHPSVGSKHSDSPRDHEASSQASGPAGSHNTDDSAQSGDEHTTEKSPNMVGKQPQHEPDQTEPTPTTQTDVPNFEPNQDQLVQASVANDAAAETAPVAEEVAQSVVAKTAFVSEAKSTEILKDSFIESNIKKTKKKQPRQQKEFNAKSTNTGPTTSVSSSEPNMTSGSRGACHVDICETSSCNLM